MFDPFDYLRRQAASAVMSGVADACQALTPDGEQPPADLEQLRGLIAARLALPAAQPQPDDNAEPAKRRGKVGA